MATRLYLRLDAAEYTPSTARGTWDDTSQVENYRILPRKAGTPSTRNFGETSTTGNWDVLTLRFVSDPLTPQTISGTFDICIRLLEGATAYNLFTHIHAYVVHPADDSVVGTLISNLIDATEWPTPTATFTTLTGGPFTISPVTCGDGDRIVVEFGFQAQNTSATNSTNSQRIGGVGVDGTAGDTTSTSASWLEFSDTILFKQTYLFLNDISAPATPAGWVGAWDDTGGAVDKKLGFDKSGSGVITSVGRAETNTNTAWDVALARFVSPKVSAVTISGTYSIYFGLRESNAAADMFPHIHMYIMKPDGTSRGNVIADVIGGSEITTSAGSQGLVMTGSFSSLAAQDGDRLVLEIGYRATNNVNTSYTGTLNYGGDTGTGAGDLLAGGDSGTSANLGGWVQMTPLVPLAGGRAEIQVIAA